MVDYTFHPQDFKIQYIVRFYNLLELVQIDDPFFSQVRKIYPPSLPGIDSLSEGTCIIHNG